ncbi:MAG: hypothetical protein AAGE03_10330 [Pseudomonadota bacterium]
MTDPFPKDVLSPTSFDARAQLSTLGLHRRQGGDDHVLRLEERDGPLEIKAGPDPSWG